MGFTTDFLGHITIAPSLNSHEIDYLTAFSESRRWDRDDGPYEVPDHPRIGDSVAGDQAGDRAAAAAVDHMAGPGESPPASRDLAAHNRPGPGQPHFYCQWVPCSNGCCLSFDGTEEFYEPARWMIYLIQHFLTPGAEASRSGLDCFSAFTFDHVLNGAIAASRRDTRRLWLIRVDDNTVTEEDIIRGEDESLIWGSYPYEDEIDRRRMRRRAKRPGQVGEVRRAAPATTSGPMT